MSQIKEFNASYEDSGKRLDQFLVEKLQKTRADCQRLIKSKKVAALGQVITKPSFLVKEGQYYAVLLEEEQKISLKLPLPEHIPLEILYEDKDILVVNKSRDMVVYPTISHPEHTLVNALLAHCTSLSNLSGEDRPGIVHRLDKNTSGLMVVAKNNFSHEKLVEGFSEHSFRRFYEGIVYGVPKEKKARVVLALARDKNYRTRMAVDENGKEAITNYEVISENGKYSLVKFSLETGRTHQIRVHMAYLGNSLYGDELYGRGGKKSFILGQALHAYKLVIQHPRSQEWMTFETTTPEYFLSLCGQLQLDYQKGDESFVK